MRVKATTRRQQGNQTRIRYFCEPFVGPLSVVRRMCSQLTRARANQIKTSKLHSAEPMPCRRGADDRRRSPRSTINSCGDAGEVWPQAECCRVRHAVPTPLDLARQRGAHDLPAARPRYQVLASGQASGAIPRLFHVDYHPGLPHLGDGGRGRHGPFRSQHGRRRTALAPQRQGQSRSNCSLWNSLLLASRLRGRVTPTQPFPSILGWVLTAGAADRP
jgi:hypothetical protein